MSDLSKQLRKPVWTDHYELCRVLLEAADRIDALEAEVARLTKERDDAVADFHARDHALVDLKAEVARLTANLGDTCAVKALAEVERQKLETLAAQLAAALADIVAGDIRYFPNTPTWAEGVVRRAQAALAAAQAYGIEP